MLSLLPHVTARWCVFGGRKGLSVYFQPAPLHPSYPSRRTCRFSRSCLSYLALALVFTPAHPHLKISYAAATCCTLAATCFAYPAAGTTAMPHSHYVSFVLSVPPACPTRCSRLTPLPPSGTTLRSGGTCVLGIEGGRMDGRTNRCVWIGRQADIDRQIDRHR